ncbi:LapD/MoxY N-terminal periplasmic domain-containing protein [Microbulbifer agarilyticus]|uniref:LapD/MoxY N-terminal periplasmic domain-containing protein n=1 Tax=Microbulbifer agarilyticus TaxID=260552 RepID=UPI0036F2D7D3
MLAVQLGSAITQHHDPESYTRTLLQGVTQNGAYSGVTFTLVDFSGKAIGSLTTGATSPAAVKTVQHNRASITPVHIRTPADVHGVPRWFQQLMRFQPPSSQAEVRSGWEIAGTVAVRRHPAPALQLLWRVALGLCGTGLLILAIVIRQSHKRRLRMHHCVEGLQTELAQSRSLLEALYKAENGDTLAEKQLQETSSDTQAVKSRTEA